ncbi:MAG TPA: malto-oligosyltrehalose trehalohydrolase [Sinorhizobium sp.]|nr:malto-oligosyltrehalose trehalohydrolase [Sinorhizobium sp.]
MVRPDETVRFRLWAPGQSRVSVALGESALPMQAAGGGWFELTTDAAGAGTAYAFQIGDGMRVADPASRCQREDVHGPSVVVDPQAYAWRNADWRGRPWSETVLYELHVGAFSREGDFDGVQRRLDWLEKLGVTAIELMPIADFPGRRGWGYDGVLQFAPERAYGAPDDLKALIDAAHERGLMMFLDVVYNHFGPDGNYLGLYAPEFFTDRRHTPWGAAIDFAQPVVRSFFIHNALYWLNEYRFDGLRFDAVHAIRDDSTIHILTELAQRVRDGRDPDRHVHLVLENDANEARFLRGDRNRPFDAQWNDDFHHVSHVVLTRESQGYYSDYQDRPVHLLGRAMTQGFVYQGQASAHRNGAARGEPTTGLPLTAFVGFLQNHDQVGNRAFGERLSRLVTVEPLRALTSVLLLAPHVPLLFMGEEWAAEAPFFYFCDFHDELAAAVRDGRRREFAKFPAFSDPQTRARIPDPNAEATFEMSKLDWADAETPQKVQWLEYCRTLLDLRRREVVPRLRGVPVGSAAYEAGESGTLRVIWRLADSTRLSLIANLNATTSAELVDAPKGRLLHCTHAGHALAEGQSVPPWFVAWFVAEPAA